MVIRFYTSRLVIEIFSLNIATELFEKKNEHHICHTSIDVYRYICRFIYIFFSDENFRFPSVYPTSCLLGCVQVIDCLPQEEYRRKFPNGESESPFVFICEEPIELDIRFPVSGQHKICK